MNGGVVLIAVGMILAASSAGAPSSAFSLWDIRAASRFWQVPRSTASAESGICLATSSDYNDHHQAQRIRTERCIQNETQWQENKQQQALREVLASKLSVVLVVDPPSGADYKPVPVTGLTKAGILPWVANLTDTLTATDDRNGAGLPLKVEKNYKLYTSSDCLTYAECVSEAIHKDDAAKAAATDPDVQRQPVTIKLPTMLLVAYQMTQFAANVTKGANSINYTLPADRLRLTTFKSFFEAAEATALANYNNADATVWRCVSSWNASTHQPVGTIRGLAGSVLVLPRFVPLINDHWHTSVTDRYGSTSKWTAQLVFGLVRHFVAAAQVKTVPGLEESWLITDKLWLNQLWHSQAAKESQHTAELLEVVPVEVPQNETEALAACWSQEHPPEADVQATMKVIFESLQALHLKIAQDSADRSIATPEGPDTMRSYIFKRTFSEGGRDMIFFDFPTSALLDVNNSAPWLARKPPGLDAIATNTTENPLPLLDPVARHIIRRGCTAKWMLQFMIKDFALSEYHVYLVNAAEAGPGDAWVVYKPTVQDHNASSTQLLLKMAAVDIPAGHFASELLPDWESDDEMHNTLAAARDAAGELPPGPLRTTVRQMDGQWRQKTWLSPKMYDMLVGFAINGLDRWTAGRANDGKLLLPALHKTFARMDIGVFLIWNETTSRREVVMRVNEFGFVNDAGMLGTCWDTSSASLAAGVCNQNSPSGNNVSANSSRVNAWEESCSDATPQQLRDAMVASQSASLAAAYSKALLRQVAWTALDISH